MLVFEGCAVLVWFSSFCGKLVCSLWFSEQFQVIVGHRGGGEFAWWVSVASLFGGVFVWVFSGSAKELLTIWKRT